MKLEELINKHYDKLNHNDMHIWKYIFNNKKECTSLTIDELAAKCNVSRTTILRFAQKLSLKGYSELKTYLRWELDENNYIEEDIINRICNDLNKSIEDMRQKDFTKICRMIYEAKRVFVYGTGAVQTSVAQEIKRIFLSGQECFYIVDGGDETEMLLRTISSDDLIILISLTGESDHIINFAKGLNLRNVPIISITKLKNNELARLSKENIYITTSKLNIGTEREYEATTAYFILVEILFAKYSVYKSKCKEEVLINN